MSRMLVALVLVLGVSAGTSVGAVAVGEGPSSGCAEDDWPQFRHDSCNSGATSGANAPARAAAARLRVAWTYKTGSAAGSPVVANGAAYVVSGGGRLHALDLRTGRRRWSVSAGLLNSSALPAPLVHGEVVVSLGSGSVLRGFDVRTGAIRWKAQVGGVSGGYLGSPILSGANVIVLRGAAVTAVAADTGAIAWSTPLDCFGCTLASDGARVYAAGATGTPGSAERREGMFAFDAATGDELWHAAAGRGIDAKSGASPSVAGKRVYARLFRGDEQKQFWLASYEAESGARIWQAAIGEAAPFNFSVPAVGGSAVVYPSTDGKLYALDASTGRRRWAVEVGLTDGSPAIGNGVVYVVGARNRLLALDVRYGRVLWRSPAAAGAGRRADWSASPALAGGFVLVGTREGLVAYRPAAG